MTTQEYNVDTPKSNKKLRSLSNDNERITLYENCQNTQFILNQTHTPIHSHPSLKNKYLIISHNTKTQE